jgi:glycosyltransferase involved in cell wall biosynthesis
MTLRVLHVLESLAPGGMETTFLNMLRARGATLPAIESHVLAFDGGALEDSYRAVARSLIIGQDSRTIDGCLDEGYDVVHILFERCAYRLMPRIVGRRRTPVVYSKGYDMGGMYRLNEGLHWQADVSMLVAADGVTFTTSELTAGYELPAGRAMSLRKAVDVSRFAELAAPDSSTPQRIVCIANLHPRKRLGDLVQALVMIRHQIPDAELRFVGGGNAAEASRLAALARGGNVGTAVTFAGMVRDVAPEIAAARIVALPSSCEGVPTVLLEAMAAGRPVVATRVGHISSIVDNGVEGFLVPVGDITALSHRVIALLNDPALAASMGHAGRRRAARHDVTRVAIAMMDAVQRAVHGAAIQ